MQHLIGDQCDHDLRAICHAVKDVLNDAGTGVCIDPNSHGVVFMVVP